MSTLRFGAFELRPGSGELRRNGDLVKLPPQPFKVLEVLVRRGGDVVTRAEIREQLWSNDTFVDFDQALNFCIRQIREALGDDADSPRFIQTLPRRGYRLLERVESGAEGSPPTQARLIVLPLRLLRPDAETDFLAFSLPDALTSSLSGLDSLVVRSSLVASRFAGDGQDPRKIATEADVDLIVTGTLVRAGDEVRVSAQLTDATAGTLLWSHTAQVPVGDVFQVQDALTERIANSLLVPLTARERRMLHSNVPASKRAYEDFLRANQLSLDPKRWAEARELYERCVDADPRYAPAWARLGRMRHVMAKFLDTGTRDQPSHAEDAFRRALELNPDLTLAHKLYAQFEVDQGRAQDAMVRLLSRQCQTDSEWAAGLVSTCRYCGLLDASVAADTRARRLEPKIRSSVHHTWFLQRDYARVAKLALDQFPYIVALSLDALGRGDEAVGALRQLETTTQTRLREFIVAARTLLEGDTAQSLATVKRIGASDFKDPEALFYLTRHLAHLGEADNAVELFERVVSGGYSCYPAMASDPWLDPLRKKPAFARVLKRAQAQHQSAVAEFARLDGRTVLQMKD